ncbi:S53 family peptidase [Deminuibacter soli]|uniref:Peptidase S53 n=1 Tax=Deminuibacter soli TaxID=2291815 RepID=A0A3E1NI36_9BACT|nr:S53 family peptidase [Deminuibacter soli]RFM27597.1 peptidase S53 [Deminuibacter soli]
MKSRFSGHVLLPGSDKQAPDATRLAACEHHDVIEVSLYLKPPKPLPAGNEPAIQPLARTEFNNRFAASNEDLQTVAEFAHTYGLTVVRSDAALRLVELRGTIQHMQEAFKVSLSKYKNQTGQEFRGREGVIQIPEELSSIVEGVFGLDNRPLATPKFQVYKKEQEPKVVAAAQVQASFNPNELAKLYNYPSDVTGKDQCIAIIELGGGYKPADITSYFAGLQLTAPKVVAISVDGATNAPSTPDSADGEVLLDIEVAGAVAPGATIAVYFAPNTDKGFLDAIKQAVHDATYKPSVVSISWGAAEEQWTSQSLTTYNQAFQEAAALGVSVCAAAGDSGSNDNVNDGKAHVDFPASSPYVLGCGGTKLDVSNGQITSEVVWHESNDSATGGGISAVFPLPDYQQSAAIPVSVNDKKAGRGVPDVAAVADPATGYNVLVDGQRMVIGGTSAVAPLMAGLIALINESLKKQVGFIHPQLYAATGVCRDITSGNNITVSGNKGYTSGKGWDACTGIGVPDGMKLRDLLKQGTA